MKRYKILSKIFIILIVGFISFSGFYVQVNAQNLWTKQNDQDKIDLAQPFVKSGEAQDIRDYVVILINVFLTFLGLIMVVLIIWGGYNWMTSRGEQAVVDKAKEQIKAACIGLVIILAAYLITGFVVDVYYHQIYDPTFQLGS